MRDWLYAGAVWIPALILGVWASHHVDPFLAGWLSGGSAALIRGNFRFCHALPSDQDQTPGNFQGERYLRSKTK